MIKRISPNDTRIIPVETPTRRPGLAAGAGVKAVDATEADRKKRKKLVRRKKPGPQGETFSILVALLCGISLVVF